MFVYFLIYKNLYESHILTYECQIERENISHLFYFFF